MDMKIEDEVKDCIGEDSVVWLKKNLCEVFHLAELIEMTLLPREDEDTEPIVGIFITSNYSVSEFRTLRHKITDLMFARGYHDVYNSISICQWRSKSD